MRMPYGYFLVSAVFHYLGPAFAVLLFARVQVLGVAWLRIASAGLIFAVGRRQTANTIAALAMRSQATPSGSTRLNSSTAKAGPR